MAQLIPTTPIQGSSPEQIRLFNVLKRLPEEFVITQRLPVLHGPGPDFLLTLANQMIFLSVSKATPQDAVRMQQPDLFGGETNRVGRQKKPP